MINQTSPQQEPFNLNRREMLSAFCTSLGMIGTAIGLSAVASKDSNLSFSNRPELDSALAQCLESCRVTIESWAAQDFFGKSEGFSRCCSQIEKVSTQTPLAEKLQVLSQIAPWFIDNKDMHRISGFSQGESTRAAALIEAIAERGVSVARLLNPEEQKALIQLQLSVQNALRRAPE